MYVSASPRTRTLTLRVGTEDAKPLTPMTLIFCDPGGIRTHALPIKSRRLEPTQLRSLVVEPTGYDPVPLDFQSSAMTTSATAPYIWVYEEFRNPDLWLHTPFIFVTPVGYDPTLPILKVWCFPDLATKS